MLLCWTRYPLNIWILSFPMRTGKLTISSFLGWARISATLASMLMCFIARSICRVAISNRLPRSFREIAPVMDCSEGRLGSLSAVLIVPSAYRHQLLGFNDFVGAFRAAARCTHRRGARADFRREASSRGRRWRSVARARARAVATHADGLGIRERSPRHHVSPRELARRA